jgi:hypothetical protein
MSFPDLASIQTNEMLVALAILLAVAISIFFVMRGLRRMRSARLELNDPPPLVIPGQRRGSTPPPLYPMRFGQERAPSNEGLVPARTEPDTLSRTDAEILSGAQPLGAMHRNGHGTPSGGHPAFDAGTYGTTPSKSNGGAASKVVHTIPPMDGTLQFLPGRLEVMDGENPGRDIRFVRTWGEIPEITFGRVSGPPYRHVQLRSQTVSRQHARMQYIEGRWKLTNLSQTNPVIINGQSLESAHGNRVLHDGDQIEMGEVVFRFRER